MMPTSAIPIATRVAEIKKIFNDFGIAVAPNSVLDQSIAAEFGRGKKSILTKIVTDLQPDSSAAVLAECIGHALQQERDDPYITAIATVMKDRIPSLLQIIDVREVTTKRIELLQQLLQHFEVKIQLGISDGTSLHEKRMLRMLRSAQEQLRAQQQVLAFGRSVFHAGVVCDVRELQLFGKVLQAITPLLVAINQSGTSKQQIANLAIQAIRVLAQDLQSKKLDKAASILEDVHMLALINFPKLTEVATVHQVLATLGISIGVMTTHKISQAARARGLTEKELLQVLQGCVKNSKIVSKDYELLKATEQNQRFAASCGLLSKLGAEIECKPLQQIGIAGMCLVCMRQTFYEVKTLNTNLAGFSESLGLFLTGVGHLSNNSTITKLGNCVLSGVKAYAGIMAIPGGQAVAIPLAICATIGKLVLGDRRKLAEAEEISDRQLLQQIVQQIIHLHLEMRLQFKTLFGLLEAQHAEILKALDDGFTNLTRFMRHASQQVTTKIAVLDVKIDVLQYSLSTEFRDLYLEYIQDPLDELAFYSCYSQIDQQKIHKHKLKFTMWLLYKAKHEKANGKGLIANLDAGIELAKFVDMLLQKITDYDSVLGMLSRYLNLEFDTALDESIPHAPTWLLCVDGYLYILHNYADYLQDTDKEPQIIKDIIVVGTQLLNFIEQLAQDVSLAAEISQRVQNHFLVLQQEKNKFAYFDTADIFSSTTEFCAALSKAYNMTHIVAMPAPDQLEQFDAGEFDITGFWNQYLRLHIPNECFAAQTLGLGSIMLNYSVDPGVNAFHEPHLQYGGTALPDSQRDVIFRIDVFFKFHNGDKSLVLTGWNCYDLGNAQRRFDEYYQRKFKYGLQHTRYLWIGLNGRQNRVVGHGVSETTKLIDYQRLGEVYKAWWHAAQPAHTDICAARLQQSPRFMQRTGAMLAHGHCVQTCNVEMLSLQLVLAIQQKLYDMRLKFVSEFRGRSVVQQSICKIDAYLSVANALQNLLNCSAVGKLQLQSKFQALFVQIEQDFACNKAYATTIDSLLHAPVLSFATDRYSDGSLYQRVQFAISKLHLFLGSVNPALRLI